MRPFTYSPLFLNQEPIWGWGLWLGSSEPNLELQWIGISSEKARRGTVCVTLSNGPRQAKNPLVLVNLDLEMLDKAYILGGSICISFLFLVFS